MKAIIWTRYGSPAYLRLQEVDKPILNDDQILVKLHAASVTAGDCEMRRLELPLGLSLPMRLYSGFFRPKRISILGQEFSGEVVEIGKRVENYQKGDQVFGTTGFKFGAYSEYVCLPAQPGDAQGTLAIKPAGVTPEEAATIPTAGLEALHYFRNTGLRAGQKVLIVGGGGSIGTFAIQLAKLQHAVVTAVDSTVKQELMLSLGADHVIDYTKSDYRDKKEVFDLIIDVVGRREVSKRLKLLKPGGSYYLAFAQPLQLVLALWTSLTSKKKLIIQSSSQKMEDLEYLGRLLSERKIKSVIDRIYPLEEIATAHDYAESGSKKGNIAITISQASI